MSRATFQAGLAAGIVSGMRFPMVVGAKKEPVAYLYGHVAKEGETPTHTINGVDYVGEILPALPEGIEETYKYKFINANGSAFYAFATSVELKFHIAGNGAEMLVWERKYDGGAYKTFDAFRATLKTSRGIVDAPEWEDYGVGTYIAHFDSILWSNYDIFNESGELYLEASEPIPVYE